MDVDRLDEEERADCMAKGLCFICKKCGHCANSCPEKKKKKVPVRQEKIEEEDDETENRRLAEDF
jgi:heterodisulfide reductase subunit C